MPEKEKDKTEKCELLEKAGISLGVARAEKRLSTSLLVLADADLWFWPQSGFLWPCFWKTWQGFNLKCGLWMVLVWSKSEGTVSSQPTSLSKWGQSHDIMTSLALTYRQPLVNRRLQGNIPQIGLESPRRQVHPSFLSLLIVAWVMFWSVCDRWECPHWQRGILPSTLPMQYRAYFLPGAPVLPLSYLVFYKKYHLFSLQS